MANKYIYNVWKRKTASAQVKLFEGKWKNMINWIDASKYVKRADLFDTIYSPLKICKIKDNYYFEVAVSGSWVSAQADAIRHWLAKNLAEKDSSFKKLLREAWFLTRDARKVERKKPGKHKARKSIQWSKR